jgi:hypothetical protein
MELKKVCKLVTFVIISEDWLEVSEGVNDTKECYECFKKEQRGREWENLKLMIY